MTFCSHISDVVFRYEACFAVVCRLKPTRLHRWVHCRHRKCRDQQLKTRQVNKKRGRSKFKHEIIFHNRWMIHFSFFTKQFKQWNNFKAVRKLVDERNRFCDMPRTNIERFPTVCEQRPLWKTQLMAVLCLAGVKSFCIPEWRRNSQWKKGIFLLDSLGLKNEDLLSWAADVQRWGEHRALALRLSDCQSLTHKPKIDPFFVCFFVDDLHK